MWAWVKISDGLQLVGIIQLFAHEGDSVSVSYTHLDVYKRQRWELTVRSISVSVLKMNSVWLLLII